MQSTGHSSMHALSFTSTQGSAITYVTKVSSDLQFGLLLPCWSCCCSQYPLAGRRRSLWSPSSSAVPLLPDTSRPTYWCERRATPCLIRCPRGAAARLDGVLVSDRAPVRGGRSA